MADCSSEALLEYRKTDLEKEGYGKYLALFK
jgi:hypothetical protein